MSGRFSTRVRLACVADAPPPQLTRSEPLRPDTEHRHTVFPGLRGCRLRCAHLTALHPRGPGNAGHVR